MRQQKGYVFHKGTSWFVRYCDDIIQPDGTIKRMQPIKKLDVAFGKEYGSKKSVAEFVKKMLAPVNAGELDARSTMLVSDFVETVYLPKFIEKKKAAATLRQYKTVWTSYLKPRVKALTLRSFRTVDGERILAEIAEQARLGWSSLRHCKAFLSGRFKTAKRLGVIDGVNPVKDTSISPVVESEKDTHAYTLDEIKTMLARLTEPARTVVLTAARTGLRKSELWGLRWKDYDGTEIKVERSVWNGIIGRPKTRHSRAPVAVVPQLREALERHRLRMGVLAQPDSPIFQAGNGKPLNLDNLVRRAIAPSIERCKVCQKPEAAHKPEGHMFELDPTIQWHGWHAFRRGLATNLYFGAGVDDKTVQAIMRHGTLKETQDTYIKKSGAPTARALDTLADQFDAVTCNDLATNPAERVQ